jgi:FkbM family methyltransferase
MQELLGSWLEPGHAFYDVGAHVGFFTLGAARLVGPQGRVVALEPDARNYERLKLNVERNGMTQIRLLSAAAWNEPGTATFELPDDSSSRVEGRLALDMAPQRGDRVSVPTVLLDAYFGAGPCVVKVDVEGAEAQVLQGARRFLDGDQTRWVIELHSDEGRRSLTKSFERADYEVSVVAPTHPEHSSKGQNYLVAVPRV